MNTSEVSAVTSENAVPIPAEESIPTAKVQESSGEESCNTEDPVAENPSETAEENLDAEESEQDTIIPEESIEGAQEAKEALTPAEYDAWLTLQRRIHFSNRFRVERAKRSEKKERYTDEQVVTQSRGDTVSDTLSVHLKEDYMELVASADTKSKSIRLIEGVIEGFRYMDTNSSDIKRVLAVVSFGHGTYTVLIPDYVLFNYSYTDTPSPEILRQVENRIRRMIGAKIQFVCKYVNEKDKIAYGDRLKALEFIGWQNYTRPTRSGLPRIRKDSLVQAQVIAVADNYIIVNAEGSDTRIMKDEIAWEYIVSCKERYKVNDKITCKVLAVETRTTSKAMKNDYNLVATKLSIKRCTEDPAIQFYDNCSENSVFRATVTEVNEAGVFVNIQDKVSALMAFPAYGPIPKPGDNRAVRINRKEYDEVTGRRRFWGMLLPE